MKEGVGTGLRGLQGMAMAVWSEMGAGARMGVGAAAAVVVLVAVYFGVRPAAEVAEVAAPVKLVAPAAPEAAPVTPAPEPAPEAVVQAIGPTLDVVRVGPQGETTIAGRAGAGEAVRFLLEGAEVFSTLADANGNFVGLFSLPSSEAARMLSVVAKAADGAERSVDVAIAPIKPVVVAEAAPPAAAPVVAAEAPVAEAPAALLIAPEGVKVVQPAAAVPAEVAANVSVDSITYATDGAVQLGGRGLAGSALRVYLDQAAVAEARVGPGGDWAVTLGEVAAGVYTLRVDQLGADGKVVSRFETPFKRETLEALAAAAAPKVAAAAEVAAAPEVTAAPEVAPAPAAPVVTAPEPAAPALPEVAGTEAAPAVPSEVVEAAPPAPEAAPEVAVAVTAPEVGAPAALADPAPAAAEVAKTAVSITVQPGFTLWGIAKREFGDGVMYVQVFNANKDRIKNPDLIYPGQVFTIPGSP
jgi:nucleoid-associated protein YgaU